MKTYYYVSNRRGRAPRYKHETLEAAIEESQRLAILHPEQTFEVLKAVAITAVKNGETIKLED